MDDLDVSFSDSDLLEPDIKATENDFVSTMDRRETKICESTGTLPSTDNYDGVYGFNFSVKKSPNSRKSYLYSSVLHQVFVRIDNTLVVEFTAEFGKAWFPLYIRALLVYTNAEHLSEPVTRCVLHALDDDPSSLAHSIPSSCQCRLYNNAGHVIRCSSPTAAYNFDPSSLRHSVIHPLERPQAGSKCAAIPYTFACKTSCAKGMRRRSVQIIFTLEDSECNVYGRKVLPVKICSCPKRDKERRELAILMTPSDGNKPSTTKEKPETCTLKFAKSKKSTVAETKQQILSELREIQEDIGGIKRKLITLENKIKLL